MEERKFPEWFTKFYRNYLEDRVIICRINGVIRRKLPRGSPQGGVFSPIFWNIAFDELLAIMNSDKRFLGVGFADDASLLIRGVDLPTMVSLIQAKIPEMLEWAKKYGVEFCPKKTTAMIFYKIKPKKLPPKIKMGESLLSLRINQ